jgi:hypothetical protein
MKIKMKFYELKVKKILVDILKFSLVGIPATMAAHSRTWILISRTLRSWVRFPPKAWMFSYFSGVLSCVGACFATD